MARTALKRLVSGTTNAILGGALSIIMATAAIGAPVLRAEITVTTPIVTIGDMFDDAGIHAERAIFRSPVPGTAGRVSLGAVRNALVRAGIKDFVNPGVTSVRVTRTGITVNSDTLTALIAADLAGRGITDDTITVTVRYTTDLTGLAASDIIDPVKLVDLRYAPASTGFTARFTIAGANSPLNVKGQIELLVEAPHLARSLPAGQIIDAGDIEWRLVPLRFAQAGGIPAADQLVGMQLRRAGRGGLQLRTNDVAEPQLIARNETVTVYFRSGPLTVTVNGLALNAASLGEPVAVLNTVSKNIIRGTATRNGAVEVTTLQTRVAAL